MGMRETPLLFIRSMAEGAFAGRKRQTRNLVNRLRGFGPVTEFGRSDTPGYAWHFRDREMRWHDIREDRLMKACPFGQVGDLLWVREPFSIGEDLGEGWVRGMAQGDRFVLFNDGYCDYCVPEDYEPPRNTIETHNQEGTAEHWREFGTIPSILMPRWASRLCLEITGIRVERLHDISKSDAVDEGLVRLPASGRYVAVPGEQYFGLAHQDPRVVYSWLWDHIGGAGAWAENPYVWVIQFTRKERP